MFFEQYSHEPFVATPRYIVKHLPADHARRAELPERLAKGRAALAVMDEHLKVAARSSSPSATRSPTSRCTPTRTSRTKAATTSTPYASVRAWLVRVAAQPGNVGIYARPRGLTGRA